MVCWMSRWFGIPLVVYSVCVIELEIPCESNNKKNLFNEMFISYFYSDGISLLKKKKKKSH